MTQNHDALPNGSAHETWIEFKSKSNRKKEAKNQKKLIEKEKSLEIFNNILSNDSLTINEASEQILKSKISYSLKTNQKENIADARQLEILRTTKNKDLIKNNQIKDKYNERMTGTLIKTSRNHCYGFIKVDNREGNLFLHVSDIKTSEYVKTPLYKELEGTKLSFDIALYDNKNKTNMSKAINVTKDDGTLFEKLDIYNKVIKQKEIRTPFIFEKKNDEPIYDLTMDTTVAQVKFAQPTLRTKTTSKRRGSTMSNSSTDTINTIFSKRNKELLPHEIGQ